MFVRCVAKVSITDSRVSSVAASEVPLSCDGSQLGKGDALAGADERTIAIGCRVL